MSIKGSKTVSDYLDFDRTLNKGIRILNNDRNYKIGFLIVVGINTGLRISDILTLRHLDFIGENIELNERKTGKYRKISINENIKKSYKLLKSRIGDYLDLEDFVFTSQKNCIYSVRSINRLLKKYLPSKENLNISSHSLRKTFGRRIYENYNESEKSLMYLSEIFCHSSQSITRKYLGIRDEEISNIYLEL